MTSPSPAPRIGILGGSFDPVHVGHLAIAEQAVKAARLDRVVFVPAADSPFKIGQMTAPASERLHLLALAVCGDPRFEVSDVEIRRGGVSYSIDTVERLVRDGPDGARWFFIIGADNLSELHRWHRAAELVKLCSFLSFGRDSAVVRESDLGFDPETNARLRAGFAGEFSVPVSSTMVRRRLLRGESVRGLVPESVEKALLVSPSYCGSRDGARPKGCVQ